MPFMASKTVTGWGVVREEPWEFVGLYETQLEAAALAIDMGIGYAAHFGEFNGKDNFVWGSTTQIETGQVWGPQPADSNKRNERDASEANSRTVANVVQSRSAKRLPI
jgi:hypothetical protein